MLLPSCSRVGRQARSLTLIFGVLGTVSGWTLWLFERLRQRSESRNQILTEIVEVYVESLQNLNDANAARKTRERLIRSYVQPAETPQAAIRAQELFDRYNAKILESSDNLRRLEAHDRQSPIPVSS